MTQRTNVKIKARIRKILEQGFVVNEPNDGDVCLETRKIIKQLFDEFDITPKSTSLLHSTHVIPTSVVVPPKGNTKIPPSTLVNNFDAIEKLPKINKYMMATTAIHKLGDISRNEPDLCHAKYESDDAYYGSWVTGFGFFNVCFPKETTRELTPKEIKKFNKKHIQIAGNVLGKLKVD